MRSKTLLATNPTEPTTLGYCGLALLQGGAIDAAIAILGQAVAHAPANVEPRLHLATALATGGSAEAVGVFRQVLAMEPGLGMALFNAAQIHDRRGDTPRALAMLRWGPPFGLRMWPPVTSWCRPEKGRLLADSETRCCPPSALSLNAR